MKDVLDKALASLKGTKARPYRITLTRKDWNRALPCLAPPVTPDANASYRSIPVFLGPRANTSNLWVRANDGQLGNLQARPLAGFEA